MNAKHIGLTGLLAAIALTGSAPAARAAGIAEKDIKLSGCLVRGEGDGAGYFLSNAPAEPSLTRTSESKVAPSALGTSGSFNTIFYWLHGNDDLKSHVGNRVEIEGEFGTDPKPGDIKVDRKERWTELTVKSDGRTMKANIPHTSVMPAPGTDGDSKNEILVRRVDVSKVRMLAASCEP